MIEVRQVSKHYDNSIVVDQVSLTIPAGGITSIIGPNGAGKSTLLSMISRLMPMTTGSVVVDGLDVTRTAGDVLAKKLAILRQDNHLPLRLTVRDLVEFGRFPHSRGRLSAEDMAHVDRAIAWFDLAGLSDRYLDELSGGQRQRAFVAMVLCQDTDCILLDEPLNNLDMSHGVAMMKQLRRLSHELGKTVVVVLHDINFAARYSDRIIAMKQGRLAVQGGADEVIREEILSPIYAMPMKVHNIGGQRMVDYY